MEQFLVLVRVQRHVIEGKLHRSHVIDAQLVLHDFSYHSLVWVLAPDFLLLLQILYLLVFNKEGTTSHKVHQTLEVFCASTENWVSQRVPAHKRIGEVDCVCEHFFFAVHLARVLLTFRSPSCSFSSQFCFFQRYLLLFFFG